MEIPTHCVPLLAIMGATFLAFTLGWWWVEAIDRRSRQDRRKGGAK